MAEIVILWTRHSDYMHKLLLHFIDSGYRIHMIQLPISDAAPYDESKYFSSELTFYDADNINFLKIVQLLKKISPRFVIVSSWSSLKYMAALKVTKNKLIMCMDNQWSNSIRQRIGVILWRIGFFPKVDIFFVPGQRQERFARKLQKRNAKVVFGLYNSYFSDEINSFDLEKRQRDFLFVGRLVKEKGFHFLIEAYSKYRTSVSNPWNLKIAGAGELAYITSEKEGVRLLGFLNGERLSEEYQTASAFILPSLFEPWGVVVHDATCFGLPLILSKEVGAGDDFLIDGENGFLLREVSVDSILAAMLKIHSLDIDTYESFSKASLELSKKLRSLSSARFLLRQIEGIRK